MYEKVAKVVDFATERARRTVLRYEFTSDFEHQLVTACCCRYQVFSRIGVYLDHAKLSLSESSLALRAAHSFTNEMGYSPTSLILVTQVLRRWLRDGKVTVDEFNSVVQMFDSTLDRGLLFDDEIVDSAIPVVKARMRFEVLSKLTKEDAQTDGNVLWVVEALSQTVNLGVSESRLGVQLGHQIVGLYRTAKLGERHALEMGDLDAYLNGGVLCGTMTMFLARTSGGKSIALGHIACNFMRAQIPVCYASFELPEYSIAARCHANLTGISIDDLLNVDTAIAVEGVRRLESIRESMAPLFIRSFTAGTHTPQDVLRWVSAVEAEINCEVGCLVIDYLDRVAWKSKRELSSYKSQELITEHFQSYAQVKRRWVFTACQAKNQGAEKSSKRWLSVDDCADSIAKPRLSDYVFSINYPEKDSKRHVQIFVAKNRHGEDGMACNILETQFHVGRFCDVKNTPYTACPPREKPSAAVTAKKSHRRTKKIAELDELPF